MCPALLPSPTHLEPGSGFGLILRQFRKHLTRTRKNFCLLGQGDLLKNLTRYFSTSHSFKIVITRVLRGHSVQTVCVLEPTSPSELGLGVRMGGQGRISLQVRALPSSVSITRASTEGRNHPSCTPTSPQAPTMGGFKVFPINSPTESQVLFFLTKILCGHINVLYKPVPFV